MEKVYLNSMPVGPPPTTTCDKKGYVRCHKKADVTTLIPCAIDGRFLHLIVRGMQPTRCLHRRLRKVNNEPSLELTIQETLLHLSMCYQHPFTHPYNIMLTFSASCNSFMKTALS